MEAELLKYGYLFIFLGTIVEGDATLLTAAFLAHRGYFHLSWVLVVSCLSTLLASQTYYLVAMHNGGSLLDAARSRGANVDRLLGWASNRGGLLVLGSRFVFGLRTLIPMVCGAGGMNLLRFSVWNGVGALIWVCAFGTAGYLGGHLSSILIADIRRYEKALATALAVSIAGFILWRTHGRELFDLWLLRPSHNKPDPNGKR